MQSMKAQSNRCQYLANVLDKYGFLLSVDAHPLDSSARQIISTIEHARKATRKFATWHAANPQHFDGQTNELLRDREGKPWTCHIDPFALVDILDWECFDPSCSHKIIWSLRKAHKDYHAVWQQLQAGLRRAKALVVKASFVKENSAAKRCKSLH